MSDITSENINKKARLGRGLGSLLGGAQDAGLSRPPEPVPKASNTQAVNTQVIQLPPEARIWQVNIDKLRPSAFQPRTHFEKAKLEELAVSIKQNGIIQPIVGRKTGSGAIEIIAGERRWRAAQLAGLHEVPVILKNMQDQATLEMAIIENIQREDLNPVEEAEAYQRLSQEFQMTQQQIAEKVGKDRATVANIMRLLGLPDLIRQMILKSEISSGHAKVLLSIADQKTQIDLAKKIVRQKMSVRQLEKMAAAAVSGGHKEDENVVAPESNVTQRLISGLAEELQKIMGTKVSIDYHQSKGKIAVHFYSDEELTQIVDRLKDGYGKR